MACDTPIGSTVTVTVDCTTGVWQSSGLTVNAGECLQISALDTTVKFGVNANQCAYPEGWYDLAANPCATPTYDPTQVLTTFGGDPPQAYTTLEGVPYALIAKIAATQPTGTHVTGTLRPNQNTIFPASTVGAGGIVWLNFNDNYYPDNTGSFTVTLQRLVTTPPYPVFTLGGNTGSTQGTRFSPISEQVYQALSVSFPLGYAAGVDLASQPTLHHIDFTSVRVRGPYRAYLVGTVLHVVNDLGELPSGAPLEGVDILRIGT